MVQLHIKTVVVLLVLAVFSRTATAQEAPLKTDVTIGSTLDFTQALEQLKENKKLKGAELNEAQYNYKRKAALGHYLPRVDLMGSYMHMSNNIGFDLTETKGKMGEAFTKLAPSLGDLAPVFGQLVPAIGQMVPDELVLQDRDAAFLSANVIWPIFTGGKIYAGNKIAKLHLHEAKEETQQQHEMLITELVERYFGLRLAERVYAVRQSVVEVMQEHYDQAVKLETNGIISEAERLHATVALADAKRELQTAKSKLHTVNAALANTLSSKKAVTTSSPLFNIDSIECLDYFKAEAQKNNIRLKMVETKKEMAHVGVIASRSLYMPTIAAVGHWRMLDNDISTHLVPNWMVGATLQWTLFDGAARTHKYLAANKLEERVEVLETKAQEDIETLVTKLYNEVVEQQEQIKAIEATEVFAKEYVRVRKSAFQEGFATSVQLVDAELMLTKVKTGRLKALYDYDLALAKLLEAAGLSHQFDAYRLRGKE